MTCREMDNQDPRRLSEEARRHLEECERCRDVLNLLQSAPAGVPSQQSLARARKALLVDLKPVRPLPAPVWFGLAFFAIFIAISVFGAWILGPRAWHILPFSTRTPIVMTLSIAAGLLSGSLARQMIPGSRVNLPAAVTIGFITFALLILFAVLFQVEPEADFVGAGLICLRTGIAFAIPSAALCWLLFRKGALLEAQRAGAILGTLAGLAGLTVLELHCTNFDVVHILVWHVGVVLVALGTGVILGVTYSRRLAK